MSMAAFTEECLVAGEGEAAYSPAAVKWDRVEKVFTVRFHAKFWEGLPRDGLTLQDGRTVRQANYDWMCDRLRQVAETGDML